MSDSTAPPLVLFRETEVVLDEGGAFRLDIANVARTESVSLVIDIYALGHPVHPSGHVGWRKFALTSPLRNVIAGRIAMQDGRLIGELDGLGETGRWVNDAAVAAGAWAISAVLRDNVSNAILSLHRVPVLASRRALTAFRNSIDRVPEHRGHPFAGFAPPAGAFVRIVAPDVIGRDAVGNLCFDVRRLFLQNGVGAELYANHYDLESNDIVRPVARLAQDLKHSDTILYFFSTADPRLPEILRLACAAKVAYYHGVTRPEAIRVFDPELAAACAVAFEQVPLLQGFDRLAANSAANAVRLLAEFGADTKWRPADIRVIGPRILAREEGSAVQPESGATGLRLLAVGRIKSHKKLEHVLELFAEILNINPSAELSIAGGGGDKAYRDYLAWMQHERLRLPDEKVRWLGSVSASVLADEYRRASAYISMSEDEGFGMPLLEAMTHGVPVIAYDIPATREVLGGAGVCFARKDFASLALQVTALLSSETARREMIAKGRARAQVLASAMDGSTFLSLVFP